MYFIMCYECLVFLKSIRFLIQILMQILSSDLSLWIPISLYNPYFIIQSHITAWHSLAIWSTVDPISVNIPQVLLHLTHKILQRYKLIISWITIKYEAVSIVLIYLSLQNSFLHTWDSFSPFALFDDTQKMNDMETLPRIISLDNLIIIR